jgi:hypothetical protein
MGKRIGRSNRTEGPGHLPRPCVDAAVSEFMTNQNSRSHDLSISLFFLCRNRERDILAAVLSQWQHCSSVPVSESYENAWHLDGWLDGVGQLAEDDAWRDKMAGWSRAVGRG